MTNGILPWHLNCIKPSDIHWNTIKRFSDSWHSLHFLTWDNEKWNLILFNKVFFPTELLWDRLVQMSTFSMKYFDNIWILKFSLSINMVIIMESEIFIKYFNLNTLTSSPKNEWLLPIRYISFLPNISRMTRKIPVLKTNFCS